MQRTCDVLRDANSIMWQKAICQKAYVVCHPSREEILDSLPPPPPPIPSVGHRCFKTISGTLVVGTKRPPHPFVDAAGGVAEVSRPTILTFALNSTKHIA